MIRHAGRNLLIFKYCEVQQSSLLPCPKGLTSRAFVIQSLTQLLTQTPFPPRACIEGMASTRFPGLVYELRLDISLVVSHGVQLE